MRIVPFLHSGWGPSVVSRRAPKVPKAPPSPPSLLAEERREQKATPSPAPRDPSNPGKTPAQQASVDSSPHANPQKASPSVSAA